MDYSNAIEIGMGIYWVGYNDVENGMRSNPYLIIEEGQAVLIDGGSRPDFSTVMAKILQTKMHPNQIERLIYQHYDPDLVGSVSNFESIINNEKLEVISQKQNNVFIQHYSTSSKLTCINHIGNEWRFESGRKLKFINIPYAHAPGSFITYDEKSKTLFTSDLFGAYGKHWDLYIESDDSRESCITMDNCPESIKTNFLPGFIGFHEITMPSNKALRHALDIIKTLDVELIAPQHGSLIKGRACINFMIDELYKLDKVGIDGVLKDGEKHIW